MQIKFSNCFVRVSPSTYDFKFHFLAQRYKRRSPDKDFHVNDYRIFKRSGRANVTLDFKSLAANVDTSGHKGSIFKRQFDH